MEKMTKYDILTKIEQVEKQIKIAESSNDPNKESTIAELKSELSKLNDALGSVSRGY